jgi:hypothetical protein
MPGILLATLIVLRCQLLHNLILSPGSTSAALRGVSPWRWSGLGSGSGPSKAPAPPAATGVGAARGAGVYCFEFGCER